MCECDDDVCLMVCVVCDGVSRVTELTSQLREYVALHHAPIVPISARGTCCIIMIIIMFMINIISMSVTSDGTNLQKLMEEVLHALPAVHSDHDDDVAVGKVRRGRGRSASPSSASSSSALSSSSSSSQQRMSVSYGTVLNLWTNRKDGTVLHIVIKGGEVS